MIFNHFRHGTRPRKPQGFTTRSAVKIHPDDPFLDPSFIGLQHSDPLKPPFAGNGNSCNLRQMFHAQTIDSMVKLQDAVEKLWKTQ